MKKKHPIHIQIRRLAFSGVFLALALALPFLTGQIPQIGSALSPMHIPVLLCGFVCGWPWGLAVGFVAPLLRTALFGMPPILTSVAMAFELAAYGACSGALYRLLPKRTPYLYVSLLAAMVLGRIVWGAARFCIAGLQHTEFPLSAFWAGAVINAVPGHRLPYRAHPADRDGAEKGRDDAQWRPGAGRCRTTGRAIHGWSRVMRSNWPIRASLPAGT